MRKILTILVLFISISASAQISLTQLMPDSTQFMIPVTDSSIAGEFWQKYRQLDPEFMFLKDDSLCFALLIDGDTSCIHRDSLGSGGGGGGGTDDQNVVQFQLVGNEIRFELEDDGQPVHTIDLSAYLDNTDNQTVDNFSISGHEITLELEDDGEAPYTLIVPDTVRPPQLLSGVRTAEGDTVKLEDGGEYFVRDSVRGQIPFTHGPNGAYDTLNVDGTEVVLHDSIYDDQELRDSLAVHRTDIDENTQAIIDTAQQIRDDFPVDTDEQAPDQFDILANVISLSLERDGVAPFTIDLTSTLDAYKDPDWYGVGTTEPPISSTANIYTEGNVVLGSSTHTDWTHLIFQSDGIEADRRVISWEDATEGIKYNIGMWHNNSDALMFGRASVTSSPAMTIEPLGVGIGSGAGYPWVNTALEVYGSIRIQTGDYFEFGDATRTSLRANGSTTFSIYNSTLEMALFQRIGTTGAQLKMDQYSSATGADNYPTYSWDNDTNSGLFWYGNDYIGLTTGSQWRLLVTNGDVNWKDFNPTRDDPETPINFLGTTGTAGKMVSNPITDLNGLLDDTYVYAGSYASDTLTLLQTIDGGATTSGTLKIEIAGLGAGATGINGLSNQSATEIKLGGTLIENTVVDGDDSYQMYFDNNTYYRADATESTHLRAIGNNKAAQLFLSTSSTGAYYGRYENTLTTNAGKIHINDSGASFGYGTTGGYLSAGSITFGPNSSHLVPNGGTVVAGHVLQTQDNFGEFEWVDPNTLDIDVAWGDITGIPSSIADGDDDTNYWNLTGSNLWSSSSYSVGIRDATPSYSLDVNGTFRVTGPAYLNRISAFSGGTGAPNQLLSVRGAGTYTQWRTIGLAYTPTNRTLALQFDGNSISSLVIDGVWIENSYAIYTSKNVGVNVAPTAYDFQVNGNAYIAGEMRLPHIRDINNQLGASNQVLSQRGDGSNRTDWRTMGLSLSGSTLNLLIDATIVDSQVLPTADLGDLVISGDNIGDAGDLNTYTSYTGGDVIEWITGGFIQMDLRSSGWLFVATGLHTDNLRNATSGSYEGFNMSNTDIDFVINGSVEATLNATQFFTPVGTRIGAGRTPSTYPLEVGGSAYKTGGGDTWDGGSSDRRIKENIALIDVEYAYAKFAQLKPSSFTYTNYWKSQNDLLDETQYSFIAQDVEKIIPEAVEFSAILLPGEEDPVRTLKHGIISAYHKAATIQLIKENEDLKSRVEKLELLVNKLINK